MKYLDGCSNAARIATSEFLSPGLHRVSVKLYDSALLAELGVIAFLLLDGSIDNRIDQQPEFDWRISQSGSHGLA